MLILLIAFTNNIRYLYFLKCLIDIILHNRRKMKFFFN